MINFILNIIDKIKKFFTKNKINEDINENKILYRRPGKVICASCGKHIYNLTKEIYNGDIARSEIFTDLKGNILYKNGKEFLCPLCGNYFFSENLGLIVEEWE